MFLQICYQKIFQIEVNLGKKKHFGCECQFQILDGEILNSRAVVVDGVD